MRVAANLSKNKISYNRLRMTDELQEELVAKEQEDLAFVWDAVKELPEPYREVVHLYYEEWYTPLQVFRNPTMKQALALVQRIPRAFSLQLFRRQNPESWQVSCLASDVPSERQWQ